MAKDLGEWLVTDNRGLFAMGQAAGICSTESVANQSHTLLSGLPGRLGHELLNDFAIECNGVALAREADSFDPEPWPRWTYRLSDRVSLITELSVHRASTLTLRLLMAAPPAAPPLELSLRPIWSLRAVEFRHEEQSVHFRGRGAEQSPDCDAWIRCDSPFQWRPAESGQNGEFLITLFPESDIELELSTRPTSFPIGATASDEAARASEYTRSALVTCTRLPKTLPPIARVISNFLLFEPAGLASGFPHGEETATDTFGSLPGVVVALFGWDPDIRSWAIETLDRWSETIGSQGEAHGLVAERFEEGKPCWQGPAATLWWAHALASLWAFSVAKPELGLLEVLPQRYNARLNQALKKLSGADLPLELGPLFAQAHTLRSLWDKRPRGDKSNDKPEPIDWADVCFDVSDQYLSASAQFESIGPTVLLHSLPLAPSFLLWALDAMRRDLPQIKRAALEVHQERALGDPVVPGWLPSHLDMALQRFGERGLLQQRSLVTAPFSIDRPYASVLTLACSEEARFRKEWKVDDVLIRMVDSHFRLGKREQRG